ncbi:MAG: DUF3857 domain-containing protein [Sphingobacteriales bacterium]|nr:DUF3857 domain-containing protein [Sphingobacteriales bacterium]
MSSKPVLLSLVISMCSLLAYSQDKSPVKYGNVSAKDFDVKIYPVDSNANAVFIADIGRTEIEGNSKFGFSLVYKHYSRVHILNKNGFEAANVSISLYKSGNSEEELDRVRGVTYNLENGKVVETKLDTKSSVFTDKINKEWIVKKFTMPNVKEGSIIEFEYTQKSDFLSNLQSWNFQGEYPCLWSEYNVSIPEFLRYTILTRGYKTYDIAKKDTRSTFFVVVDNGGTGASERHQFNANVDDYRWVMRKVPALKEENFTSTLRNHLARIEFQLASQGPPLNFYNYVESWPKVAQRMLDDEDFGQKLSKDNGWMDDEMKLVTLGASTREEKARRIFAFVRGNFTCTDPSALYATQPLKNVYKSRNGSVAEINLLLTAMLRHEGIPASPVMLSTRSHGVSYELYPLMSQYNYVVVKAELDNRQVFLDASVPLLGFGRLPVRCYNGHAREISSAATALYFESDTLVEAKTTSVFAVNDEKGNMVGSINQVPGYFESLGLRERIRDKGKEELVKEIRKSFGVEASIAKLEVDSLEKYDEPLGLRYEFDILEEKQDILYFNPLLGENIKDNPFKSAERSYPVEMPYGYDKTYNLQMEVPAGYEVDELPKSMVVKMNENGDGVFEYRLSQSGNGISFRSRIRVVRANYLPEEYEMLREFFNMVVAKQAEQIVFRKKK